MLATVGIALAVAALCALLRRKLDRAGRTPRELLGGRVRLTVLWNRGGAFGVPLKACALAAVSVGILAAVLLWAGRSLWTALVLGGGGANLWERVRYGKVYDYVQFPRAPGRLKRYVFNLADFSIFAGALGLLLSAFRRR
ncbi:MULTISPECIES: signal peptidase II [environmental samples]|uniref:signal peptidase II n=2 Tax=environmental samples TaxID=876090 RepID=UPI000337563C|nr:MULTISPECIES: signal peptidase II [environmental samples]CDC71843.1 lipoprotein signal peptidase [Oscillibacter sp. CAG:155]